jgi:hypothetical protein
VKCAARGTEQLNCDKPAEWHTRSPVHEPIHIGHVIHRALRWVTFSTLNSKFACLLAARHTYSDSEH